MKRRAWLPAAISLAVFIILEIASLHILYRNAELQRVWIARGAHGVMGAVWGSTQSVAEYFSLRSKNRQLAQENFLLHKELGEARELLHQAGIDSRIINTGRGFEFVPAEVVKISRKKQHNYLILNRGFEDGIKEKSGVITPGGVVGIVDAVSAHHSFAFSFQNNDISISARLGEEGAVGPLIWDGRHSNKAVLREIPLQYKFSPGDTVYTSGHSLMFPPDIPLGTVGEAKIINGATNEIEVTLFQDFKTIRYVSVVHNIAFEEIEEADL